MRRYLPILCALALALAAASPAIRAQQKPKEPPPDYFPLRVGDWWKYKSTATTGTSEFTTKVLSADKQADGSTWFAVETSAGTKPVFREWYSKPQGWVLDHKQLYLANNMESQFDPTRPYLKNPLGAGDTWSYKGKGMMGVGVDEASAVSGPETVVVPAGTFKAVKVSTKVTQGGQPVTKTYWYANWVGLVKSETESGTVHSSTELVDYSFKKR